MNRLLKWLDRPIELMLWLGLVVCVLMMLHVTADVIARAAFRRPIEGTNEVVAAWYMVLVAYLPWAWLASRDQHIVAGFFQHIGSPRFEFWLDIGVKLLTGVYLAAFVYQTFQQALRQTRAGEVWLAGTSYLPVWPTRWALPLAGLLMLLHLALRILRDILQGPGPERTEPKAAE